MDSRSRDTTGPLIDNMSLCRKLDALKAEVASKGATVLFTEQHGAIHANRFPN